MSVGSVSFQMDITGGGSAVGKGNIDISDQCYNGMYNFNCLAGTAVVDGAAPVAPPPADNSSPASASQAAPSTAPSSAVVPGSEAPSSVAPSPTEGGTNPTSAIPSGVPSGIPQSHPPVAGSSAPVAPPVNSHPWSGWRNGGWHDQ